MSGNPHFNGMRVAFQFEHGSAFSNPTTVAYSTIDRMASLSKTLCRKAVAGPEVHYIE